jgi:hypothetical protein
LRRLDAWQGRSARALGNDGGGLSLLDKLRNERAIKAIGFGIQTDTCVKFTKVAISTWR